VIPGCIDALGTQTSCQDLVLIARLSSQVLCSSLSGSVVPCGISLLRLIITQDPSLRRRYWFHWYCDPSDSLSVFSASSLSHLSVNTSLEGLSGSPTFVLLPLRACRALRPRGVSFPSLVGLADVAFCLFENMGPSRCSVFGAQSLAFAYGLQASCLRLIQFVTSLFSRLSTGGWVSFPDRPLRRLLIRRLVAHQKSELCKEAACVCVRRSRR